MEKRGLDLVCPGCKEKSRCIIPAEHEYANALQAAMGVIIGLKKRIFTGEGEALVMQLEEQLSRLAEVLVWIRSK